MADFRLRPSKPKPAKPARSEGDGFPTNEELLHELRLHGAKPPPPREIPAVSRRTRDYLLLAGLGSAGILVASFRVLHDSDVAVILRLALTGIALLCGLLWFIFYGVMSRY
ncbi:MAG: hypothetical protein NTV51_00405 [Verrucomicrobia bacterium]|nr:hypothetical protein [Verrucomicrobiota bacterium]